MENKENLVLREIPAVAAHIDSMSAASAKQLHQFIFERDDVRKNRKNLRNFEGFKFEKNSEEYTQKITYANENFTEKDLIFICTVFGLNYKENKEETIKMLLICLMDLKTLINNDDDEEDEEDDDDENQNKSNNELDDDNEKVDKSEDEDEVIIEYFPDQQGNNERCSVKKVGRELEACTLSFKDVEDAIRVFDGKKSFAVESWIADFEDLAELLKWNGIQKYIFAKKSLRGMAKLYILSERNITSWNKLKTALLEEFGEKISTADLHKTLQRRKMKNDEDVYEYFLIMKELAGRGHIDDTSLIQYVIEGIQDARINKMMLYGAKSVKEFKEKLQHYRAYRNEYNKMDRAKPTVTKTNVRQERKEKNEEVRQRCYNCGMTGHKANNCESKELGTKCFKCNKFGHKSPNCKEIRHVQFEHKVPEVNKMCKTININGHMTKALLDTGSEVNLIRKDVLAKANLEAMETEELILTGFGGMKITSALGTRANVVIDGEEYNIDMHVVPGDAMTMEVILGNEFFNEAELVINKEEIKINRLKKSVDVLNINIINDKEKDLRHIKDINCQREVDDLITSYKPEKTKMLDLEMKIVLTDETPIYHNPRRLPFTERDIVDTQVEQWITDGIVEPCISEFASQVVLVRKKDGSPRICIDYRKLNKVAVKDRYPMPILEDQLDNLQNAKIFSTIDLRNGFFHVKVEKNSRKYTSFVTHKGQFQFKRVPFGFCNSPANFQRYINSVLRQLQSEGILLIYLDDVIILAEDEQQGVERLKTVLRTAQQYGLDINFKKSQFLMKRIEFLGHIIENGQIYPSTDKVKAVLKFPEPKTVKDIQSFLGLTGFFRKFVYNYSLIARPLSDLIKKDKKFQFLEEEKKAFESLKEMLSKNPVLKIFQRGAEIEVHTDASKWGFGGILMQKSYEDKCFHPIHYFSKKTTENEEKYSSYELEVLAIVKSVQKFRVYLIGQQFKIITDCAAFKQTMNKADLSPRVARWAMMLNEFDFEIQHRSGVRMKHVDALSRYPVLTINAIPKKNEVLPRIRKAQSEDENIQTIKDILEKQEYKDYVLQNDILYKFLNGFELIVIPEAMQNEMIERVHRQGHFGTLRSMEKIKQEYYIPELKKKTEKIIANCIECILVNKKSGKQEGYLHPRFKGEAPLCCYHVDHLGPLETTNKNYKYIFAVIDDFSKFVWLYPTKSTTTKEVILKLELQKKVFGNPDLIISDKGTAFTSEEFNIYCKEENINHQCITTGLPRANGQVERINSIIISVLSKLASDDPSKWYRFIDDLQRIMNSTYQRSINMTPFELLFGTKIRAKEDITIKNVIEEEMRSEFTHQRSKLREQAKMNILKVQEENKHQYNLRRKAAKTYNIGDLVAIKRTQIGPGNKLKSKFLGPYRITKVKSNDVYDVRKEGLHEGPLNTSTCAEYMKSWTRTLGSNDSQEGRSVGSKTVGVEYKKSKK